MVEPDGCAVTDHSGRAVRDVDAKPGSDAPCRRLPLRGHSPHLFLASRRIAEVRAYRLLHAPLRGCRAGGLTARSGPRWRMALIDAAVTPIRSRSRFGGPRSPCLSALQQYERIGSGPDSAFVPICTIEASRALICVDCWVGRSKCVPTQLGAAQSTPRLAPEGSWRCRERSPGLAASSSPTFGAPSSALAVGEPGHKVSVGRS